MPRRALRSRVVGIGEKGRWGDPGSFPDGTSFTNARGKGLRIFRSDTLVPMDTLTGTGLMWLD